ncbi:hypothetical protein, conserved in T. vivax, (fragment), partial [Trypanosoma vivax Y486]
YREQPVSTRQAFLRIAVQLTHAAAEIKQFVTVAASLVGKKGSGENGAPCIGDPEGDTDKATPDSQLEGQAEQCKQGANEPVSQANVIETLSSVRTQPEVKFQASGDGGNVQEAQDRGECPLLNVAGTNDAGAVGGSGSNTIVYGNTIVFAAQRGAQIKWEENRTFRVGGEETTLTAVRANVTALLDLIEKHNATGPYGAQHKCPKESAGAIVCDGAKWQGRLQHLEESVAAAADRIRDLAHTQHRTQRGRTTAEDGETGGAMGPNKQGKTSNKQAAITGREQCEEAGHAWNFDEGRCEGPGANGHAPSYAQGLGSAMRSAAAAHVAIGLAKCR